MSNISGALEQGQDRLELVRTELGRAREVMDRVGHWPFDQPKTFWKPPRMSLRLAVECFPSLLLSWVFSQSGLALACTSPVNLPLKKPKTPE